MSNKKLNVNSLPIAAAIFDEHETVQEVSPTFNMWLNSCFMPGAKLKELFTNELYMQLREYIRLAKSGSKAECNIQFKEMASQRVFITPCEEDNYLLCAVPTNTAKPSVDTESHTLHYLKVTMDTISQGITIYDANLELVLWNPVFERMGIIPAEDLRYGFSLKTGYKSIAEKGVLGPGNSDEIAEQHVHSVQTSDMVAEELLYPPSGKAIKIHRYYLPGGGICATFTDITKQKEYESLLVTKAKTDHLTGTANRFSILEEVSKNVQIAKQSKQPFYLLFIDLDHFKLINDTYGHLVGDELLKEVTKRIQQVIDPNQGDRLGRLGGDEFAVLLRSIHCLTKVNEFCKELLRNIKQSYTIKKHSLYVSCTIGACEFNSQASIEELLAQTDSAMYYAKSKSQNEYEIYNETIGTQFIKRNLVSNELRISLNMEEPQFYLLFQPLIDLKTNQLIGVEALLRWKHQTTFDVNTQEFILILEERGMIVEAEKLVFEMALDALDEFNKHYSKFYLSINVSPLSVSQKEFSNYFKELVNVRNIIPSNINLEVTESELMRNDIALCNLRELKESGFGLAMDDFGTGFSSLAYLRDYPFTHLKIDRSFISLSTNESDQHRYLIKAIMDISRAFDMIVVAEGVETKEQLSFLKGLDCQIGQGYYFGKPQTLEDILAAYPATNS